MLKIVIILPFCFFCNVISSTLLTCLAQANSFVCTYESQYILQQPGSLKSLVIWTYIDVLVCWYYNWTLFLWCPKLYKCNWTFKEIYIQQPNIYKNSLYENIYIRPWLVPWKYFCRTRNCKRTYVYVFDCWSTDRVGAVRAHQGHVYTSLAVGKYWLGTQRLKSY